MIEAKFYKKMKKENVQCMLCPHKCIIAPGNFGVCNVRKNSEGKLYSMAYGKPVSVSIDPIEKKPLFHFFPNSTILSYSTIGCNLSCNYCQNWRISQAEPENFNTDYVPPEKIVEMAEGTLGIAHTYTEPTIFYEYAYDIAELAKKRGMKNVFVTNGFINPEPLDKIIGLIDAFNIDLKAFSDKFYKDICKARLSPVLKSIEKCHEKSWVEVTNLIVPGQNDKPEMIRKMCNWIHSLDPSIPLHFSRFSPNYKMRDLPPTPMKTLEMAKAIAEESGLKYVYLGNTGKEENTYCPYCSNLLVERKGFYSVNSYLNPDKKCLKCGKKQDFVF